jgi:hypothetical protein|tara:strand:+ start:1049 stop:1267 length:219 start_codon:yes stop_codon:yes gene_type:complete
MKASDEIAVGNAIYSWAAGKSLPSDVHKKLKRLGYKTDLRGIISGEAPVWKIDGGKINYISFKKGGFVRKRK